MIKNIILKILSHLILISGIIFYKPGALFINKYLPIDYGRSICLIGVFIGLTFSTIKNIGDLFKTGGLK